MRRPGRSRTLAATAAACLLLAGPMLAGCTNDQSQAQPAASTSAATTKPTPLQDPTPEPPTLPLAAKGSSVASVKAFVHRYIDLLNHAMVTGDTERLRAAARNCEGCDNYADLYEERYAAGGYIRSRGWHVKHLLVTQTPDTWYALLDIHSARLKFARNDTAEPRTYSPDNYELRFQLAPKGATWAVLDFRGD